MKTLKWVGIALIIAALALGVWWAGQKEANAPESPGYSMSAPNDVSPEALDQDLAAINNQLKDLDADSASIDAGLSDESLPLE